MGVFSPSYNYGLVCGVAAGAWGRAGGREQAHPRALHSLLLLLLLLLTASREGSAAMQHARCPTHPRPQPIVHAGAVISLWWSSRDSMYGGLDWVS